MDKLPGNFELLLYLRFGPIWDGNLNSKQARDDMVDAGYIGRVSGFQFLNQNGVELLNQLGFLHEETWREAFDKKGNHD